jgi:hypothetical protein
LIVAGTSTVYRFEQCEGFMKKMIALYLALLALSLNAQPVTVMGTQSCGKWIADKEKTALNFRNFGWAVGFLSGLSVGRSADALGPVDADSITLWIDNYCKANPFERMDTALTVLFEELRSRN